MTLPVLARRAVLGAVLLAGCARTTNLLDPAAPRFSGEYALLVKDSRGHRPDPDRHLQRQARPPDRPRHRGPAERQPARRRHRHPGGDGRRAAWTGSPGRSTSTTSTIRARSTRPSTSTSARPCSPAGRSSGAGRCCCRTRAGPGTSGATRPRPRCCVRGVKIRVYGVHLETPSGASDAVARGPGADRPRRRRRRSTGRW